MSNIISDPAAPAWKRLIRRPAFWVVTVVALVVLLVVLFVSSGRWNHWSSQRYVSRSKAFAAAGETDAARLAAMRALQLDGDSVAATRQMLSLLKRGDLQGELLLRCRIADLDEPDAKNLERLILLAMSSGRFDLAENALLSLQKRGHGGALVLEFEIRLRLIRGESARAENAAAALLKLDPDNAIAKLVQALSGLQKLPDSQLNEAEEAFLPLLDDPVTRLEALRGVREVKRRKGDLTAALETANMVVKETWAGFSDWLIRAGLMLQTGQGEIHALRDELLEKAGQNLGSLEMIILWLHQNGDAANIVPWIEGIEWLMGEVNARGVLLAGEWSRQGEWSKIIEAPALTTSWPSHEHVRLAYLARAYENLGRENASFQHWTSATNAVREDSKATYELAKLVERWPEWSARYQALLWQATTSRPENLRWVFDFLQESYIRDRNTEGILRVSRAKLKAFPENHLAKRNVVLCLLLLDIEKEEAKRRLFELKQLFPASSGVMALDALALLREGKPGEALLAMSSVPDADFSMEDVALVRAVALKQTGADAEAMKALQFVNYANLLKEEKALLAASGLPSSEAEARQSVAAPK